MKVYILTHLAAEENYTPSVFKNKEDAIKTLSKSFDMLLENATEDAIFSVEKGIEFAEVIWNDDTYDKFNIFEVEVV